MPAVRLGNLDWASVYMIEHRPCGAGQVVLYADGPTTEPGCAAATLTAPKDVARALELAGSDGRFDAFANFWVDLRKLRHTRDGSTAILSFGLSGGRIATVQVPAEVLELIHAFRRNRTATAASPARSSGARRKAALIA